MLLNASGLTARPIGLHSRGENCPPLPSIAFPPCAPRDSLSAEAGKCKACYSGVRYGSSGYPFVTL
jgi:hypothetical protein